MALFDTGAKDLALAAYDSGETGDSAVQAYKRAQTDGAALILGPLFGASATALAPLRRTGPHQHHLLLQRRKRGPARPLGDGHRRPAAGPPRRRLQRLDRHQALRRAGAAQHLRRADGAHAGKPGRDARRHGGRPETLRRRQRRSRPPPGGWPTPPRAKASSPSCVPVAPPRLDTVLASLSAAGVDPNRCS